MSGVRTRDDINFAETMHKFLSERLLDLLELIMTEDNATFPSRVVPMMRLLLAQATALASYCVMDGQQGLERLLQSRSQSISVKTWSKCICFISRNTFVEKISVS